jgi:lipopolysaccharide export system permease protein
MTILTRYMLRELMKIFGLCLAGLMTVYLVVDFFEKIRRFIRYGAEPYQVALYFLYMAPHIAYQIAPVALLMAILLSLTLLIRNNEITAMRSCGISLGRITLPYLGFSAVLAWIMLLMSAVVVPKSIVRADYVRTVLIENKIPARTFTAERTWIQMGNGTLMNIEEIAPSGTMLKGISVYRLGSQFELTEFTEAKEARFTKRGWVLHVGIERRLARGGGVVTRAFEQRPIELAHIPEDFNTWLSVKSKEMTLRDLRAYAERLRRDGYSFARFLTDYYSRVAFPFVTVVLGIVGLALSLKRTGSRSVGMAMGIGQALLIAFLYWTTHSIAIALGRSGVLMPFLAGWFSNILFLAFGGYLMLRVRY